ncbi:MAG: DUF3794 domain-containing protein [Clostridia bacterium]|nr:DUF3794 domain-containing protein [Clostridia bacterium]
MEMNFKKISVSDYTKHSSAKTNVDADIIVPDKNADIHRILSVTAVADVSERYVRKDKTIFGGNVKFNILYIGEDSPGEITSIEYTAPFNHQCESAGADDNTRMFSCCRVYTTGYEVKNSRKLTVTAGIKIDTKLYRTKEVEVIDFETPDKDYPLRSIDHTSDNFVCCKEFEISESDTVVVPGAGEECEVYSVLVSPDIAEIKTVNNKAVLKGSADVRILYSSGGEISDCESEVTFTEIVDVDDISPEHTVSYCFEPADYSVKADVGETDINFEVDFKIRGSVCAYEKCENILISDIYSPDYQYEITRSQQNFARIDGIIRHQSTVKDTISSDEINASVSKIVFLNSNAVCTSTTSEGQTVKIAGNIENNIIYTDESGRLSSVRHKTPFELEIPSDESFDGCELSTDAVCTKCGYVLNSSGEIQIRSIVKTSTTLFSNRKLGVINDFKVDKNSPVEKSSQPSIVVCYPSETGDLWDFAKKYNTTVDEIKKINSIEDSSECVKSKPIIIPKRQVSQFGNE